MLRKLVIVYNPNSSHHRAIEQEVLAPARKISGWLVGKYEVEMLDVGGNADKLAKIVDDGDLVIVAGGDGTATLAANGVMRSGKDATLGVLGYGNFNDFARMLGAKRAVKYGDEYVGGVTEIVERFNQGKVTEIYPLEATVDGKHWRYAPCYLTVGMFAASTAMFDEPEMREKLKSGKKTMGFSLWKLVGWYFRKRKQEFLPKGRVVPMEVELEVATEESDREEIESEAGAEAEKTEAIPKEEAQEVADESEEKVELLEAGESEKAMLEAGEPEEKVLEAGDQKLELDDGETKSVDEPKKLRQKRMNLVESGVRAKARLCAVGSQTKVKLLNAKMKTQEKVGDVRAKMKQKAEAIREQKEEEKKWLEVGKPEIIIDGAEMMEKRGETDELKDTPEELSKDEMSGEEEIGCPVEKDIEWPRGTTDYIALNSPRMARMMRGRKYYRRRNEFLSTTARLGGVWRLMWFMLRSIVCRVPGKKTCGDVIRFDEAADVMIQAEGEYQKLTQVKEIVIKKSEKSLKVIKF